MTTSELETPGRAWQTITPHLFVPRNDQDYRHLVAMLDELIDEVGEDESHPLSSLMEVIGILVESYEDKHVPEITS